MLESAALLKCVVELGLHYSLFIEVFIRKSVLAAQGEFIIR